MSDDFFASLHLWTMLVYWRETHFNRRTHLTFILRTANVFAFQFVTEVGKAFSATTRSLVFCWETHGQQLLCLFMYFLLATLPAERYIIVIIWERTDCFRFALHVFFWTHVTLFAAVSTDDHLAGIFTYLPHFNSSLQHQFQHPVSEILPPVR